MSRHIFHDKERYQTMKSGDSERCDIINCHKQDDRGLLLVTAIQRVTQDLCTSHISSILREGGGS